MAKYALQVRGLGKSYQIGKNQEYSTLRDSITQAVTAPFKRAKQIVSGDAYGASNLTETLWALKDLSFDIKHGEVVGIIGHNGAGKSTLLKVLSQITEPSEGEARIYGRIGALLEVGTGFHEELTGRENVILNGAILGMSQYDVNRRFDEIVDFAGVEKFIDTPVKHYSSGMKLRLGFAVAAHLEPEILVVDEVLAVGDAAFQKKCLGKMSDVAQSGRTVLFVSHNMAAVSSLCSRGILLKNGEIIADGTADETIIQYMSHDGMNVAQDILSRKDRKGSGAVRVESISFMDSATNMPNVQSGASIDIHIDYIRHDTSVDNCHFALVFYDFLGNIMFSLSTQFVADNSRFDDSEKIVFSVDNFPLMPGEYVVKIWVGLIDTYDQLDNVLLLQVHDGDFYGSGKLPNRNKHGAMMVPFRYAFTNTRESIK